MKTFPDSSFLDDLCAAAAADLGVAGAQIAVGDRTVRAAGTAGTANARLGTPVRPDTLFQIGSTTKVNTAVLVLQLVDAGLLDVDPPVAGHLPDMPLAADGRWNEITPRQLMSMTSGLDNGPYTDTGRGDDCVARYVDLLAEVPMFSNPARPTDTATPRPLSPEP